jgi:NitT/TauT family transport system ATP-binding protein
MAISKGVKVIAKNLALKYQGDNSENFVLQNVSFQISPGEIVAICGKSGVGKSSLLRLIAGLNSPSAGFVEIDGERINCPISRLGYVTQDYSKSLFPWLNVAKNVALPLNAGKNKRLESTKIVSKVLSDVNLLGNENLFPWQLSGGMQQRVAIARAIVNSPRLLLLDEPFASVDTFTKYDLEDLVINLSRKRKVTTIFVTHDIDEAIYMSDSIIVLKDNPGKIILNIKNTLPWPRNQMKTRSNPKFPKIRNLILANL